MTCEEWVGGGPIPIEKFAKNEDGHIGYYKWANVKVKPFFGITEEQKMDAHIAEYEVKEE